jgi:large subunit ribosomal protein L24
MIKRHVRPTQDNPKGGVMEREGTIHISNLRLVNRPKAARAEKKKKESKGKK